MSIGCVILKKPKSIPRSENNTVIKKNTLSKKGKAREARFPIIGMGASAGGLARSPGISPNLKGQTPEELIHELRVHQIELETQAKELRRAHLAMEESRDKYLNLYEIAPVGYLTLTYNALVADVNLTGATLLGVERNKLVRARFRKFVTPLDLDGWDRYFATVLKCENKLITTLTLKRGDGSTFPARLECIRLIGSGDGTTTTRMTISDITDSRRAEEALRESEEKYRLIADNTADNIWIFDLDLNLKYMSPSVKRMRGFTVEEAMVQTLEEMMTPESRESVLKRFHEEMALEASGTADPERTVSFETEEYCKDGSTILVENSVTFLRGADQKPIGMLGISRDVTERKQAEEAQRKNEEKFRNVFDWTNDAIMLHTLTVERSPGRFIDANRVACRMLGYTRDELLTMGPPDIVPAEHHRLLGEIIRRAATKESILFETRFLRKDGTTFPVESSGHLVTYEGKGIWVSHIRDITERKQAEEFRERLIHELAQKNAELERFTYTVSHDLKSPLITIRGFLHLLEKDTRAGDTDRLHDDITRIYTAAKKMEDFIAALLELSRIGRIASPPVNVSLASIVHDAAEQLNTQIRERGVTLIIPDNLPDVYGDRMRLLQVFMNLLENAVKFMGDQNEPVVEISVCHNEGEEIICVQDNGIGIALEQREKIFSVFSRLNPEIAGTGIGLALVKRIVDVHGGRCWVESEGEGKGSTFCFTLPEAYKAPRAGAGNGR